MKHLHTKQMWDSDWGLTAKHEGTFKSAGYFLIIVVFIGIERYDKEIYLGLPWGSVGKSSCSCCRLVPQPVFDPWLGT